MINIKLLADVCRLGGAPGHEQRVRAFVMEQVKDLVDEVKTDAMGNVIAIKKGQSEKRIMIAAHMDEISFMITDIDKNGFLKFHVLGGFDPKTHTAQRVIVHGKEDILGVMGTKPIHVMSPEERGKSLKNTDYFIDTGLPVEKVKEIVSVGDVVTRQRELIEMGECVNAKSLDNRVSVYILIEVLKALKGKTVPHDIYATFTVQEEIGLRGATAAASGINPDFSINLDVTMAYDLPGAASHEMVTKLGKGTAIKVIDGMTVCDYRMVKYMKEVAERHSIDHQMELLPAGGTDTAGMQRHANGGSIAGGISIPLRYLHQSIEMAHKKDIKDTIDLLGRTLEEMDKYDWSFR